ncbi:MAG: copper homeostasis protein CutC [Oscillospiraceae bacterium]|nr:copper homeostasis protein CutC [Oscillospiraceae bacterium]
MNNDIKIEICCGSYEDVLAAKQAKAHRVELNSALFLGGLTPSMGNFNKAMTIPDIEILPMVRPRGAGFCYSPAEHETMVEDARLFIEHGAHGIVFGFLNPDCTVNVERTTEFVQLAGPKAAVFHRAFDLTPDPYAALETLIQCGVTRILTSGQAPSVPEGIDVIKRLVEQANGRIEILPGAGVRASNIAHIIQYTKVTQIHFSASVKQVEPSGQNDRGLHFGGALYPREDLIDVTSAEKIRGVMGAL